MILVGYIFLMDFLSKMRSGRLERKYMWFFVMALIGFGILYQMGYIDLVVNHLFDKQNGNIVMASGLTQRVGSNEIVLNELKKSTQSLLFGVGFRNCDFFLPGLIKFLYFYGLIGTTAFITLNAVLYRDLNTIGRKIIMLILVMSLFSNAILGVQPIIFYPLIFANENVATISNHNIGEKI